jgi:hypothetical protein
MKLRMTGNNDASRTITTLLVSGFEISERVTFDAVGVPHHVLPYRCRHVVT